MQTNSLVSPIADFELDLVSGGLISWTREQCVGAFTAGGGILGTIFGGAAGGGVGLGIGAGPGQAICPVISKG